MGKTVGTRSTERSAASTPQTTPAASPPQPQTFQPRRYQRGVFALPVCLRQGSKEIQGETTDFTPGGLRLLCEEALGLAVGAPLNLAFNFGQICYLNASGQITYALPAGSAQAIGIRFAGMRDWEQTILLSALKELKESEQSRQASIVTIHIDENALSLEAARISQPAVDLRRATRTAIRIPIALSWDGQSFDLHLDNFSAGGLRISSPVALASKTPLVARWRLKEDGCHDIAVKVIYCTRDEEAPQGRHTIGLGFVGQRGWEIKKLAWFAEQLESDPDLRLSSTIELAPAPTALALGQKKFYSRIKLPAFSELGTLRTGTTHAAKIAGWGSFVPPNTISNDDVNTILKVKGASTEFAGIVGRLTGIRNRRYAGSAMLPSDLAAEASRRALDQAGIDPKDLDIIISGGVARDVEEPATAYIIQEKLGADRAYCFDLVNACNGFISALDVVDAFIATGRCRNGLVAVGDILSQYITWDTLSPNDLHMSSMGYTFGDAGGAAVLTRRAEHDRQGIHGSWFLSDGSYWKVAVIPLIDQKARFFKSNAANIEKAALEHVPGGVEEVMKFLNWTMDDVKLVIPHQVSFQIIEDLFYKRLGMPPEKIFWSFPEHGNVGAASMPVALCYAMQAGRVSPGDKILLVGGSGGFGAGVLGLTL